MSYSPTIAVLIAGLLAIVAFSYRQTIRAYPQGGGAYIVSKENLGDTAGLSAAAALLIDYTLTVAVSVAAGVAAVVSAFPELLDYRVHLGIGAAFVLMLANLRGGRRGDLRRHTGVPAA
jgi:amino acid transporter